MGGARASVIAGYAPPKPRDKRGKRDLKRDAKPRKEQGEERVKKVKEGEKYQDHMLLETQFRERREKKKREEGGKSYEEKKGEGSWKIKTKGKPKVQEWDLLI